MEGRKEIKRKKILRERFRGNDVNLQSEGGRYKIIPEKENRIKSEREFKRDDERERERER